MKEQDVIEKIFRDKLQNLEVMPDSYLWENISKEINQGKKHRSISPFWWWPQYSNIAASLVVLFSLLSVNNEDTIFHLLDTTEFEYHNTAHRISKKNNTLTTFGTKSSNKKKTTSKPEAITKTAQPLTQASIISEKQPSSFVWHSAPKSTDRVHKYRSSLVNYTKKTTSINNSISMTSDESIAYPSILSTAGISSRNRNSINAKKLNLALLALQNTENPLQLLENKTKEEKITKNSTPFKRWSIATQLVPKVLAEGTKSSISNEFDNSSTSKTSLDVGLLVGYQVNHRLGIRTGLSKTRTSNSAENVRYTYGAIAASPGSSGIETIKLSTNNQGLLLGYNAQLYTENHMGLTAVNEGKLTQNLSYFEIPLELSYRISKGKKLLLNIITGSSTFILDKNQISLKTQDNENIAIGEATNVKALHQSVNIGLGINYVVYKNIYFQFEPIFKYHLNSFENQHETYQPKSFNFNTGLSYRF